MDSKLQWKAHGLKIWETRKDGFEIVVADFAPDRYKACLLGSCAPDLLEALEAIVKADAGARGDEFYLPTSLEKMARSAIAKARGEEGKKIQADKK